VTHWREQRGLDSYQQGQISQSDCEISSNCGKISVVFVKLEFAFVFVKLAICLCICKTGIFFVLFDQKVLFNRDHHLFALLTTNMHSRNAPMAQ